MNKTTFSFILLVLVLVGCVVCVAIYPYTSFSPVGVEIEHNTLSSAITLEEESIILIAQQRVEGYSSYMRVIHDNKRNVTCWKFGGGLSCIPDYLLAEKKNANT